MEYIAYFHVPKCAGTTITDFFVNAYGRDKVITCSTYHDYFVTPTEFLTSRKFYGGHLTYDCVSVLPKDLRYFTVLRNPFIRILSLYKYYRGLVFPDGIVVPYPVVLARRLDFHDWIECGNPEVVKEIQNAVVRQFVPESFFTSQVPACPQNILKCAEGFVNCFDVVGFVEEMDATKTLLGQVFSLPMALSSRDQRLNVSNVEHIEYCPKKLMRVVEDTSWLDLEFIRFCLAIFRRQFPIDRRKRLIGLESRVLSL